MNRREKVWVYLPAIVFAFGLMLSLWACSTQEAREPEEILSVTDMAASGEQEDRNGKNILIAYFTRLDNTDATLDEIVQGGDLFSIRTVQRYPVNYDELINVGGEERRENARPELAAHVENMESYDIIFLGYPNWWASIPMPIASFLEEYDFSGKTILPFCSHGGGGLGQSQTAIAKLVPDANMAEGLAINYSGGSGMPDDVAAWLDVNGIERQ